MENKMTKVELEKKLINEIHYLPDEVMEEMLRWVLLINKITHRENIVQTSHTGQENEPLSAGEALKNFLKKYESDPVGIDTSIFEKDRKTETDRDFRF
jgi:hypothetical protein